MNRRKISWEIVLAGLTFIAIGLYLVDQGPPTPPSPETPRGLEARVPSPPAPPGIPGAIVIDLKNLENLKNLEKLKNIKNFEELKKLEIELKNIGEVIGAQMQREEEQRVEKNLEQLETQLQNMGTADYKVKLQDKKIYINKVYDVKEAQWTEISPGVYVFQESFSTRDMKSMDFDIDFGNVNIVGSSSQQGEITLRATGDIEDPATLSGKMAIQKDFTSPGAVFKMSSVGKRNLSNRLNLEATLTLPPNTSIDVKTSGGHINASNLHNDQQLKTSGGHIRLDAITGNTVAKTGGGHITGDQLAGTTRLITGGGHIKVHSSNGSLSVKTGGGHIEIKRAFGSVTAKTTGGNISTSIRRVDGPLKFSTSAGNISLSIPETIRANLDVSGSTVNLADAFNFSGTKTQGEISGTLNGGGVPIVIRCGYGKVNIEPNN